MELNADTEVVSPEEMVNRIAGHMESVVGDMAAVRESQAKCEFNVQNMHAHFVRFMGDKCPDELRYLDVDPIIQVNKETRYETLVDKKRANRKKAREAQPCDLEYDPEESTGLTIDEGGGNDANANEPALAEAAAESGQSGGKQTVKQQREAAAAAAKKRIKKVLPPNKAKLADMSIRNSSAVAMRLKGMDKLATQSKAVPTASGAKPETVVDYTSCIDQHANGRNLYGMMAGEGACVVYALTDTFNFGPAANKAAASALKAQGLKLPSEMKGIAQQRDVSLSIISELMLSELNQFKQKPLFLEADVVCDKGDLGMREYIEKQPEPLRSAMWTTFKMMQLEDDEQTVGMMASIVTQLEKFLHRLRLGNSPADTSRKPPTD